MKNFISWVALIFFGTIPVFFLSADLFAHLWNWFVAVPFGVHQLSLVGAMGLVTVIGYPFAHISNTLVQIKQKLEIDVNSYETVFNLVLRSYFTIGLFWGYAAIVHSFM